MTAGDTKGNFGVEKVVKSIIYELTLWCNIQEIQGLKRAQKKGAKSMPV